MTPADLAAVKLLAEELSLSENVCPRYYRAAPTALEVDRFFESAPDVAGRARLFLYYERRQVLLAIDNLVKGRNTASIPAAKRLRLIEDTNSVFIREERPGEATLPINLMAGIRSMTDDAAAAAGKDNAKHVRAIADRQAVCEPLSLLCSCCGRLCVLGEDGPRRCTVVGRCRVFECPCHTGRVVCTCRCWFGIACGIACGWAQAAEILFHFYSTTQVGTGRPRGVPASCSCVYSGAR